MKMIWSILFMYQIKIRRIMSISKILTDLCIIKQKIKIKNTLADVLSNI